MKGSEEKELGVAYNAKAIFNIFGLLYNRDFFMGIKGAKPLAIAVTKHYDSETKDEVYARSDYFKPEQVNQDQQFLGFGSDLQERIVKMMN